MSEFQILNGEDYVPFITDIKVEKLGQTVTIYCTGDYAKTKTYRVICLECERVELIFRDDLTNHIYKNGTIDIVEFSITKQPDNSRDIYLYGRVVTMELTCKKVKLEKDW